MADEFKGYATGLDSPARDAFAVTPGAGELTNAARALYIGGDGDVTVTTVGGASVQFVGLIAGSILPVRCTHVTAATATNIVGLV